MPYTLKKNYHNSETIQPRVICLIFSKKSQSQYSRINIKVNLTFIFLSFKASQKKPLHIDTPCTYRVSHENVITLKVYFLIFGLRYLQKRDTLEKRQS